MAKEKLLQALKRQACAEILQLRHEAAERSHQLRKEYAQRLRLFRNELKQSYQQTAQLDVRTESLRFRQQQNLELSQHRWGLSEQLRPLANEILLDLWKQNQPDFFKKLLSELPDLRWDSIQVADHDLELARNLRKELPFIGTTKITGGLIAECNNRGLVIDSSLSTLTDHLWPELIPTLLERVADDASV